MSHLKIGSVTLKNNIILAPMAGVTDLPFRYLCKKQGAGLVCMEMVSAKAILYHNRNTEDLMRTLPEEAPVSLQLFGSDPEIMGAIAAQIQERPFDILDINMGCPVPKVVNNGEGSALMRDPELAEKIIRSVVRASEKPVTVKIRKGFDEAHVNAVEIAKRAEEAGACAIAVHGRTRDQFYAGKADWEIIARVKESVSIPVIGNGDVGSAESAEKMLCETGCDGVMIGRAARGNPWIFREIVSFLETGKKPDRPAAAQKCACILEHAALMCKYKGEYTAVREMRKHVSWYTFGYPHAAKLRGRINAVESMEELENCVFEIFGEEWKEGCSR